MTDVARFTGRRILKTNVWKRGKNKVPGYDPNALYQLSVADRSATASSTSTNSVPVGEDADPDSDQDTKQTADNGGEKGIARPRKQKLGIGTDKTNGSYDIWSMQHRRKVLTTKPTRKIRAPTSQNAALDDLPQKDKD